MAARGRPKGSGLDDRATIAQVHRAMKEQPGLSRRQAILTVVDGDSNLRRIEMKMNATREPAEVPGIDDAFLAGHDATAALFERMLQAQLDPWERCLVGIMVDHGVAHSSGTARLHRALGIAPASAADMADLWCLLFFAVEQAGREDAVRGIVELLQQLDDFDAALGDQQKVSTEKDWHRRTARLRSVLQVEEIDTAFPPTATAELWEWSLVPRSARPPVGMVESLLARGLGEPFVGVLAMPVAQQAIVADMLMPAAREEADPVDAAILAWSDPNVLKQAEALCAHSAFCIPALLHARVGTQQFPYEWYWGRGLDRDAETALRSLTTGRMHLAGLGGHLHFLLERRLGRPVHEEIVAPAARMLVERDERLRRSYWTDVEGIAAAEQEDDRIGGMIDPEALLLRAWRPEFDHAPYLLRWLPTRQGFAFMRRHGVGDSIGRAALALAVMRNGSLPDLSGASGPTALRDFVLSDARDAGGRQGWRMPGDMEERRRLLVVMMERAAVLEHSQE